MRSIPHFPNRRVGEISFSVAPLSSAVGAILNITRTVSSTQGLAIHFANAYNIALADTDDTYRNVMAQGDFVFTDGTPVVWAGRKLHPDVAGQWERVYGPDVMAAVLEHSTLEGPKHFLLGGTQETLERLEATIRLRWPKAQIVGMDSPPFRTPTNEDLQSRDQRIRDSGATCVWVGLGTPKQDFEVQRLAKNLPVVALAVGAAFDFLAGTTKQAPLWMQKSGTEWIYRFSQEPRRLAHRYLWGNPKFILAVVRQHFAGTK